jgi:ATP-dependent RNA helicase HelY
MLVLVGVFKILGNDNPADYTETAADQDDNNTEVASVTNLAQESEIDLKVDENTQLEPPLLATSGLASASEQANLLAGPPQQLIEAFRAHYQFPLDSFQEEAIAALATDESVMVAAPTGTGKTVVAEFGIFRAYSQRKRVFYTTPVKALSNQKFRDLRAQYGDAVGLLTGDIIENPHGYIIVMTTEVMRNMLLQTPDEFTHTTCVVFDEIHYLADSERGTTWEESIILCPKNVQLVCLSATISNASEVANWISRVHRPTRLITHTKRSVPLSLYYFLDGKLKEVIDRKGQRVATFSGVGGEAKRNFRKQFTHGSPPDGDSVGRHERPEPTPREIVDALEKAKMLPAIYFMFSRNDCEAAAQLVAMNKLETVKNKQRLTEIDEIVERYMSRLETEDRDIQQVRTIVQLARRGLGYHHAGLLPILKQLVEELFTKSLMSVVFATDTLALGVNMPAKTVVIGRLSKYDGQTRRPLLPNEFQQMAGRAGRRGLDKQGHVVFPYSPWISFDETLEIATGPLLPVESAFSVRYNSVLNLWDAPRGERVLQVLRNSLLEFQQSRRLRELESEVRNSVVAYDKARVGCLIGLPEGEELLHEYDGLGHGFVKARDDERRATEDENRLRTKIEEQPWHRPLRETLRQIFRTLAPGSLLHAEGLGWGIYLGKSSEGGIGCFIFGDRTHKLEEYKQIDYVPPERFVLELPLSLQNVTQSGKQILELISTEELAQLQTQLGSITLPNLSQWLQQARNEALEKYGAAIERAHKRSEEARQEAKTFKEREKNHPCHSCDMRKKHRNLQKEVAKLLIARDEVQERYEERKLFEEGRLQATLDGIVSVLKRFSFLDKAGHVTAKAAQLRDIFDNNGLILIEMIERGWLNDLLPQDLAEVFSWFAYDRDFEFTNKFVIPRHLNDLRKRLDELEREVFVAERQHELYISTGYNPYFYGATRAWCRGGSLAAILEKMQLAEGDIIITFNKTLDLTRQVFEMLRGLDQNHPLLPALAQTRKLIRRGVVEQIYNIGFGVMQDELEADSAENVGEVPSEGTTETTEVLSAAQAMLDLDDTDPEDADEEAAVVASEVGGFANKRRTGSKRPPLRKRPSSSYSSGNSRTGAKR